MTNKLKRKRVDLVFLYEIFNNVNCIVLNLAYSKIMIGQNEQFTTVISYLEGEKTCFTAYTSCVP